jgi:hypothetical protein
MVQIYFKNRKKTLLIFIVISSFAERFLKIKSKLPFTFMGLALLFLLSNNMQDRFCMTGFLGEVRL